MKFPSSKGLLPGLISSFGTVNCAGLYLALSENAEPDDNAPGMVGLITHIFTQTPFLALSILIAGSVLFSVGKVIEHSVRPVRWLVFSASATAASVLLHGLVLYGSILLSSGAGYSAASFILLVIQVSLFISLVTSPVAFILWAVLRKHSAVTGQ